jgi:hypothetical protein
VARAARSEGAPSRAGLFDQVRQHLGVGLGQEAMAHDLQLGAQLAIVLNDAVVHHRQAAGRIAVRMRIGLGRLAMGGPAGVPDAAPAGRGFAGQPVLQRGQATHAAADGQPALLQHGQPG